MREIRFRGKSAETGEWLYGDLVRTESFGQQVWIGVKQPGEWLKLLEVDPVTVGQYTGLEDRDGTPIYEGDVLSTFHEKRFVVDFKDGGFCLSETTFPFRIVRKLRVIGNIHDNPELVAP